MRMTDLQLGQVIANTLESLRPTDEQVRAAVEKNLRITLPAEDYDRAKREHYKRIKF